MNLVGQYEKDEIARLTEGKTIPEFKSGDSVTVKVAVIEGTNKRFQAFQGVVIARHNNGLFLKFVGLLNFFESTFVSRYPLWHELALLKYKL